MSTLFFKSTEKLVSENYPYGFKEKTTKTDWLEFKKGKGFRHVSQTINPKTGRANAPKASTYYDCMLLGKDSETGYVKSVGYSFNGNERMNNTAAFINQNFDLFTTEQIKDMAIQMYSYMAISVKAQVVYYGSKMEHVLPFFKEAKEAAIVASKTGENTFGKIVFDIAGIEQTNLPNYNPFVVTEYAFV
jgi:hypothetical protein